MDDVRLARHALLHPRPYALDVARFVLRIHFGAVDVYRPNANRTRKQSDTERANDRVAVVVEGVSRRVERRLVPLLESHGPMVVMIRAVGQPLEVDGILVRGQQLWWG